MLNCSGEYHGMDIRAMPRHSPTTHLPALERVNLLLHKEISNTNLNLLALLLCYRTTGRDVLIATRD